MEKWHYPQGRRLEPYKDASRRIIEDEIRRRLAGVSLVECTDRADLSDARFYFRRRKGRRIVECICQGRKLLLDIHPGFFRAKKK